MNLVAALDARSWNTGILGLVYLALVLWIPFQLLVDWAGSRRRDRRQRRASDTPSTTAGS